MFGSLISTELKFRGQVNSKQNTLGAVIKLLQRHRFDPDHGCCHCGVCTFYSVTL